MRQAVLAGRTAGLRPLERRRLDQICHRRHPADAVADLLTLQRLAGEALQLAQPLTLVVDERGLCRLLWVGDLEGSGRLQERLPGPSRRRGGGLRLLTCAGTARAPQLRPGPREGIVALDLEPRLWLRFANQAGAGGHWPAALLLPGGGVEAWSEEHRGELPDLCALDPADLVLAPPPAAIQAAAHGGPAATGARAGSGQERVMLLAIGDPRAVQDQRRLAELEGLVRSAGAEPAGLVCQARATGGPTTLWGEGKLREAALEARRLGASLVVSDRDLSPVQARNIERILDLPISDRSELILDIFAQRAASAAGRLQVELAQLRYRLPRLSGRGLSLSRQGGGIGTRGPGETQLEKDRRAIARRIDHLQRDVRELGRHRARIRQGRHGQRRLALVGYTNAGKSSLLNALSGAAPGQAVLAENRLFATLDPTTRRVWLGPDDSDGEDPGNAGGEPPLLITDTVGFIEELPPPLLEAFRSTFEEALEADGLLVVVDLSDPGWSLQLSSVQRVLDQLGATLPRLVIGNQIDRCPAAELERAHSLDPEMLFVSATANLGLSRLRRLLRRWPDRSPNPTATARQAGVAADTPQV